MEGLNLLLIRPAVRSILSMMYTSEITARHSGIVDELNIEQMRKLSATKHIHRSRLSYDILGSYVAVRT